MNRQKIVIAGGTGFLGVALANRLAAENREVVIISRYPEKYSGPGRAIGWGGDWQAELDGAHALVNLVGKNVNCRPTRKNRAEIVTSRVTSVTRLFAAIETLAEPPKVWVQASSLAIYGDGGSAMLSEDAEADTVYPATVCTAWEDALAAVTATDIRCVNLRIGFVLGNHDGALPFLVRLCRLGLGGHIGSGQQYISWIHLEDMLDLFVETIDSPDYHGTYNATGPTPVTNREFMRQLRRVLRLPIGLAAPAFLVRLGAPILDSDPEIALTGRRCAPTRLMEHAFSFRYPDLYPALIDLFPKP